MEYTRITFRIPTDLHQELMQAAEENSRSMNAEIIARLRLASSVPTLSYTPTQEENETLTESKVVELIRKELAKLTKAGIKLAD